MRQRTRLELNVPWPDAQKHLPHRLTSQLAPYLVDPELSNMVWATFDGDADDPVLAELLMHVENKAVDAPGSLRRLLGQRGAQRPLLRLIRHWIDYGFDDLADEPVVQLLVYRRVELMPPLSQYYRLEIERDAQCADCGRVLLHQAANLHVSGGEQADLANGGAWQAGDDLAETDNHEIIISDPLKRMWSTTLDSSNPTFSPVATAGTGRRLWQVRPSGIAQVITPPSPLQVRQRCATCGRPMIITLATALEPEGQAVIEHEGLLTVARASVAEGDFWQADLSQGTIRDGRDVLDRFAVDPEPFYVRTAVPCWLISNRALQLLHESHVVGWRCKPANLV